MPLQVALNSRKPFPASKFNFFKVEQAYKIGPKEFSEKFSSATFEAKKFFFSPLGEDVIMF